MNWRDEKCVMEGCQNKQFLAHKGYCRAHAYRWRTYGNPNKVKLVRLSQVGQFCSTQGCDKKAVSKLMCYFHYRKQWIAKQRKMQWAQR